MAIIVHGQHIETPLARRWQAAQIFSSHVGEFSSLLRANRCFWQPMRHTEWCLDNTKDWFKVGFHTYRHSFASNLAAAGVDQRVIDEFMGHQTEAMRKRYRHLFPKDRKSAIECLSFEQPRS